MTGNKTALALVIAVLVALLFALGVWQLQRLAWKTNLIATVTARVAAPAAQAPRPDRWRTLSADRDEYRHVTVSGRYLHGLETQVYALTDLGAGYWIMTPFERDDGTRLYINRGFVPVAQRDPRTRTRAQIEGEVSVTGLLRLSQTKGWFLSQPNDPGRDLWFQRDVAAMAKARHLGLVAPYFIDADASSTQEGGPKGGLTKVQFANSHLVYALTWFGLSGLLAASSIGLLRSYKHEERA